MTIKRTLSDIDWLNDLAINVDDWYYSFENINRDVGMIVKSIIKESSKLEAFKVELTDYFALFNNKTIHSNDIIKFIKSQNLSVSMYSGVVNTMVNFGGVFIKGILPEEINLLRLVFSEQLMTIVKCEEVLRDVNAMKYYNRYIIENNP